MQILTICGVFPDHKYVTYSCKFFNGSAKALKKLIQFSLTITVGAIAWVSFAVGADAAKVNLTGSNVTSIEDLEIGHTRYDVNFIRDSGKNVFGDEYPGNNPFGFKAVKAITEVLNSVVSVPITVGGQDSFNTVWFYDANAFSTIPVYTSSFDSSTKTWNLDFHSAIGIASLASPNETLNFAVFSNVNARPVPEPVTILGSLTAGGLFVAMKRRKKVSSLKE